MPQKKYFLSIYKESLKTGQLPSNGLCNCVDIKHSEIFNLFMPFPEPVGYWAADKINDCIIRAYGFSELRQTILLFCAAINGEL